MSIQNCILSGAVGNHHVALRVSSLERSAQFFIDTLGADWLSPPLPIDEGACHYLFDGPEKGTARYAFVGFESAAQPAFELIEFVDPQVPTGPTDTWQDSIMHMCLTVPDVAATLARVEDAGGSRYRDIKTFGDGENPLTQVYFRDPDGNLFQMLSQPVAQVAVTLRGMAASIDV